MEKSVFISISMEDFQKLVTKCVSDSLQKSNLASPESQYSSPINIKQAAEFLNLSVATIYGKVGKREIPFMKKGNRLYFYKEELESYIRGGKIKTKDQLSQEAHNHLIKSNKSAQ